MLEQSLVVLQCQLLLERLGLLPLPLLCPVRPVDCGVSWRPPVPVGAVVARLAVGSTDRGGVTWRAHSSSVRYSGCRVASSPLPPPAACLVPGGTPSVSRPAPAGDRSPRSCPLGLGLRSSAPAERSRLGLSGSLSPPAAGGADFDHSSAVVSLDFDWFSSSWSWPSRGTSLSWRSGQVSHMLDAILSCIVLWGFNVGFSPTLFLPFSLLCYGRFLSPLS